jgi:hypothetical protein
MKFTVVFRSTESTDLSYGLVFIPCPTWVRGDRKILTLNPENPHYQPGSVRRLLNEQGITLPRKAEPPPPCTVVIHPGGHGDWSDLQALLQDLRGEHFRVQLIGEVA